MEPMECKDHYRKHLLFKNAIPGFSYVQVLNMPKTRDVKLPCQNDLIAQCNDLMIQYNQLLCLRAELARLLLSRSKRPPSRKGRITRRNRLERAAKLNERPASCAPILQLISDHPQT